MSEAREYTQLDQESGCVRISEDVFAAITAAAVKEVEGVYGLSGNLTNDIAAILGIKSQEKGVKLVLTDNTVAVECNIVVRYNYSVIDVAKAVQECTASAIESMTGIKVSFVNVNVCGIVLPDTKSK